MIKGQFIQKGTRKRDDLAKKLHNKLKAKWRASLYTFVIITIVSFALAAVLVIFNLFAIRFNPAKDSDNSDLKLEQWLFVIIAILTAVTALINAILSLMTLKQRAKESKEKMEKIDNEIFKFNTGDESYEVDNKESVFLNRVNKIINE